MPQNTTMFGPAIPPAPGTAGPEGPILDGTANARPEREILPDETHATISTTPGQGFLVVRLPDGFGEVYSLTDATSYTLGRAPTNQIVLRDDLCSREHAEIFAKTGRWHVRDRSSLNGTHINNEQLLEERRLCPLDELRIGRTRLLFVENLEQLGTLMRTSLAGLSEKIDGLKIKERFRETRYMLNASEMDIANVRDATREGGRVTPAAAVTVLYRLALEMADATTPAELCERVIEAMFRATPADVGAVLAVKEPRELELIIYRHRRSEQKTYHKVSAFVSHEVLATKQAVLAENVADDPHLRNRESLTEQRVTSLICAPVLFGEQVLGVLHLYSTAEHSPLNADDLEFTLAVARQFGTVWHKLRRQVTLSAEVRVLKDQLKVESELVGASSALRHVEAQIERVAATKATVLIRGESGVGKELIARAIHKTSPRRDGAFVTLNCAALTETLLESELFGHEKGAFTGAVERVIGKFEAADNGTIFLDEIGEMALSTQAKFLRVLEGHPFERLGGKTSVKVDVRVVAATNRSLEDAVRAGIFRRDLFYRLQVVQLDVPPLRNRLDDVPLIAEHFLNRFVRETGRKIRGFTLAAVEKLKNYHWPGNVRELKNVIERAVALGCGPVIDAADIWLTSIETARATRPDTELLSLADAEKRYLSEVLSAVDWNKSQAAAILQIERSTLDRKIRGYALTRTSDAPAPTQLIPAAQGSGQPLTSEIAPQGPDMSTLPPIPHETIVDNSTTESHNDMGEGRVLDSSPLSEARKILEDCEKALREQRWNVGAASKTLFSHRQALTRKVIRIFDLYSSLRSEFPDLSERFPSRPTNDAN